MIHERGDSHIVKLPQFFQVIIFHLVFRLNLIKRLVNLVCYSGFIKLINLILLFSDILNIFFVGSNGFLKTLNNLLRQNRQVFFINLGLLIAEVSFIF
jgi:hypothetical protein